MCDLQECDVCGATRPAEMVDYTTVAPIAPVRADICRVCQIVQNNTLPESDCMQCGDDAGTGFSIEIEFPLGPANLPGRLAGTLCGDCASEIASRINYTALDADEEVHQAFLDTEDEMRRRVRSREA